MTAHPELKIAIVYDRVNTRFGGAEHVLAQLLAAFPKAPLFTPIASTQAAWVSSDRVKSSFLQRLPYAGNHHEWLTLFMPAAVESLDLREFDVIISVSSAEAKGVLTLPHQLHICYLLSPPRYLYRFESSYQGAYTWTNWPVMGEVVQLAARYMKWWDQMAIWRPDVVVPISHRVSQQIETTYGRTPDPIIYPPFVPRLKSRPSTSTNHQRNFMLSVSRLTWYKRVDLSIQACLAEDWPLVVVGEGRENTSLQQLAGHRCRLLLPGQDLIAALDQTIAQNAVLFTGALADNQLAYLFDHAKAVLSPGVDDFGLTPLDALHHWAVPVIVQASGVAEVLIDGQTAIVMPESSVAAVRLALRHADHFQINSTAKAKVLKLTSPQYYIQSMTTLLYDEWQKKEKLCPKITPTL